MATIKQALAAKALEVFDLPDWETRMAIRPLWVNPGLWDWTDSKMELHQKAKGAGGRTLFEHLEQTFCDFRCADPFPAGDLKQMMPTKHGVRTLRPEKLRVYGWCPGPHQFVAVCGVLESDTKEDKSLNDKKRDEVLGFIQINDLQDSVLIGDVSAVFPKNN